MGKGETYLCYSASGGGEYSENGFAEACGLAAVSAAAVAFAKSAGIGTPHALIIAR